MKKANNLLIQSFNSSSHYSSLNSRILFQVKLINNYFLTLKMPLIVVKQLYLTNW